MFRDSRDAADSGDLLGWQYHRYLADMETNFRSCACNRSQQCQPKTMLYDLQATGWIRNYSVCFGIPAAMMPEIRDSDGFGNIVLGENKIPIRGVAGDQQAALYTDRDVTVRGQAKNTYGTGVSTAAHW